MRTWGLVLLYFTETRMGTRIHQAVLSAAVLLFSSGQAQAAPILNFIIDGDTFNTPFTITNASTSGELVTRFQLDLAGTGYGFDTVEFGPPNGSSGAQAFAPVGGTDVTTGLVGPVVVPDGATLLDVSFTDFGPSEFFSWLLDVDPFTPNLTVFGNNLIGATALVDFSNGVRLIGELQAVPGNSDASAFTVTGVTVVPDVPEPGSLAMWGLGLTGIGIYRRRKSAA